MTLSQSQQHRQDKDTIFLNPSKHLIHENSPNKFNKVNFIKDSNLCWRDMLEKLLFIPSCLFWIPQWEGFVCRQNLNHGKARRLSQTTSTAPFSLVGYF